MNQLHSSIFASPQGNNITHLNVAHIESFPALMIHLNKSAFFYFANLKWYRNKENWSIMLGKREDRCYSVL